MKNVKLSEGAVALLHAIDENHSVLVDAGFDSRRPYLRELLEKRIVFNRYENGEGFSCGLTEKGYKTTGHYGLR